MVIDLVVMAVPYRQVLPSSFVRWFASGVVFMFQTLSSWDILKLIRKKEGITGLFKGLKPQLVRTVLASALMLTAKERIASRSSAVLYWLLQGIAVVVGAKQPSSSSH